MRFVTKRFPVVAAIVLALSFTATACDDDGPTDPSDEPDPTFRATLSSANEVPPVTNAEAGASGVMDITINAERDASGAIVGGTVSFEGTLTGFPAGTAITMAHIHTGAAGATGGVVVNLALSPGEITLGNGSGTIVKADATANVETLNNIVNNPGGFYFNAHTAANPGGAVRGQLVRTN